MKSAHTKLTSPFMVRVHHFLVVILLSQVLAGCAFLLPFTSQLPEEIPGIPSEWSSLQGLMEDFGLPDLSSLGDIPGLETLTGVQAPAGSISFQGPVEFGLVEGQHIPGTDLRLVAVESGSGTAQFEIAGLRAPRKLGDSLDYDGPWPNTTGVTYHLRLRIYQFGNGRVRAAGVQQLVIENVTPQGAVAHESSGGTTLRFPHTITSDVGEAFAGMSLRYGGQDDRGATIAGLPDGEYPYRKLGDSVEWSGLLTPNIPVVYHLRMLYYQDTNATVGGVVIVSLPGT